MSPTVDQSTAAPTRKVTGGAVGAAAVTLLFVVAQWQGWIPPDELPQGVEGAGAALIGAVLACLTRERA